MFMKSETDLLIVKSLNPDLVYQAGVDVDLLEKSVKPGEHWVTIKDEKSPLHGRHILLDGDGNVKGGNLPKAMHGKHITKLGKAHQPLDQKPDNPLPYDLDEAIAHPKDIGKDYYPMEQAYKDLKEKYGEKRAQKYLDKLDADLKELWSDDKNEMAIRTTPEGLSGILDSGRIKSTYETGKRDKEYLKGRSDLEWRYYGVDKDIDPKHRPIYGYLKGWRKSDKNAGEFRYGDIDLVLKKDSLKDRTTYTFGDSLNYFGSKTARFNQTPTHKLMRTTQIGNKYNLKDIDSDIEYIELQFHGGVSVKDIDHVVIPDNTPWDVVNKLKKTGIPYEMKKTPRAKKRSYY
jgi:hypothetical protein